MSVRLFPEAIRSWFAVEPDDKFCAVPGRPAFFLDKPKDVEEDDDPALEAKRENLRRIQEAKAAEHLAKSKESEHRRYLVANLFPPTEAPPTLKPALLDPMARPPRRNMSTGIAPSEVARGVCDGYLNEKIQIAQSLLVQLRAARQRFSEQVRKMSSGAHSSTDYARLIDEMKDIKFRLNKVSKTVRIAHGDWIQYREGTINVLLMAFVGDINFKCVDVTSKFESLVRHGGVRGRKLDVLQDFDIHVDSISEHSLTLIFMGRADMEESSISKHDTGLTWTPKFKPAEDLEPMAQPEPARKISEHDVVLRDLFNGFSTAPEVTHNPFMTTKITDLEVDMMKYEVGGMACCSQDKPPILALFVA